MGLQISVGAISVCPPTIRCSILRGHHPFRSLQELWLPKSGLCTVYSSCPACIAPTGSGYRLKYRSPPATRSRSLASCPTDHRGSLDLEKFDIPLLILWAGGRIRWSRRSGVIHFEDGSARDLVSTVAEVAARVGNWERTVPISGRPGGRVGGMS